MGHFQQQSDCKSTLKLIFIRFTISPIKLLLLLFFLNLVVGQLIAPAVEQWTSIIPSISTFQEFIAFAGLDKSPPVTVSTVANGAGDSADGLEDDDIGERRSQLIACTFVFLGVIKRCRTW